ncbi:MAG TPA: lytic transglycosylase domain-containing protein [Nocardioidaceae bacterium]|nr:lytic transglycosylase domain-containing protein [Nocardioidaceae bacterium]
MSREQYVPKHRAKHRADRSPVLPVLTRRIRHTVMASGVAVAVTGVAVSSGVALGGSEPAGATASLSASTAHHDHTGRHDRAARARAAAHVDLSDRTHDLSRSARRTPIDQDKKKALNQDSGGQVTLTEDLASGDPRDIARALLPQFGFSADQFSCLDSLYMSESGWNIHATNASSGAYGIPQALPASKMSSAGPDWQTNAATQIRWGLEYIRSSYGTPCGAWSFKQSHNWY